MTEPTNTRRDDGGLAFPGKRWEELSMVDGTTATHQAEYPGLSLRDYFAGQALVGIAAAKVGSDEPALWLAERSYAIADAMIKERSKT